MIPAPSLLINENWNPMRLALVLLFATFVACPAVHARQAPATDDRAARVTALLPEIDKMYTDLAREKHLPGVVWGVILDGKLVHTQALGYADVERKIPASTATRFRIASMSKNFVALAALRLRDEGKLRLEDRVDKYLPELRAVQLPTADTPPLTIAQLMTMTTGLPEDNPWGDRQMALSNAALEKFVGGGLSFSTAPGTAFEYSNLGYVMLGKVVSKAAKMRFQDYVTKQILLPLGMKDTVWEYAGVADGKLALGYQWDGAAWVLEPILHDGDAAAMGGLITTMDDFARYVRFHLDAWPARDGADSGPVKRATVREMHMPRVFASQSSKTTRLDGKTPNPLVTFYGYGLRWSRDSRDLVTLGHGGGLPGFGSQFYFAPQHGVATIAFSNLRYGPVYQSTAKAINLLAEKADLKPRAVAPTEILLTRQQQVVQLLQGWDEALGARIAAENFFLDRSRIDWIKHAAANLAPIGKIVSVGPIKAENRLRGSFPLVGEKGTLTVSFTLTPEREPKVQALDLKAEVTP
jgi:CubicO group peptidase (beta-lactamase class C family)